MKHPAFCRDLLKADELMKSMIIEDYYGLITDREKGFVYSLDMNLALPTIIIIMTHDDHPKTNTDLIDLARWIVEQSTNENNFLNINHENKVVDCHWQIDCGIANQSYYCPKNKIRRLTNSLPLEQKDPRFLQIKLIKSYFYTNKENHVRNKRK